jgi:hypothetical protein
VDWEEFITEKLSEVIPVPTPDFRTDIQSEEPEDEPEENSE